MCLKVAKLSSTHVEQLLIDELLRPEGWRPVDQISFFNFYCCNPKSIFMFLTHSHNWVMSIVKSHCEFEIILEKCSPLFHKIFFLYKKMWNQSCLKTYMYATSKFLFSIVVPYCAIEGRKRNEDSSFFRKHTFLQKMIY